MARKKRQRRANYSEEELSILLQETKRRKNILLGKYFVTIQAKNDEWEHVTAAVNAVSNVKRERDDIRKKFYDYRTKVKRKISLRNKEIEMTDEEGCELEPLSATEDAMLDILSDLPTEMAWSEAMVGADSEEDNITSDRNGNCSKKNVLAADLRNFRIDKEGISRDHYPTNGEKTSHITASNEKSCNSCLQEPLSKVNTKRQLRQHTNSRKAHEHQISPGTKRRNKTNKEDKVTNLISLSLPNTMHNTRKMKKKECHTILYEPSLNILSKPLYVQPPRPDEKIHDVDSDHDHNSSSDNPLGGVSMKVLINGLSSAKSFFNCETEGQSKQPIENGKLPVRSRRHSQI